MKYYREINFIDQHWIPLLNILSSNAQLVNTIDCLVLFTIISQDIEQECKYDDRNRNALACIQFIKKCISMCQIEEHRIRVINILLSSMDDNATRREMVEQWNSTLECYYPEPAPLSIKVSKHPFSRFSANNNFIGW